MALQLSHGVVYFHVCLHVPEAAKNNYFSSYLTLALVLLNGKILAFQTKSFQSNLRSVVLIRS